MRTVLSAQQLAHYKNHGSIEFEIPHDIPFSEKIDQWRENESLLKFLKKEIGKPALELSHQKQLHIGVSFWITPQNKPQKGGAINEIISIQGASIACVMSPNPKTPEKKSPLGIVPVPTDQQNVLFFDPKFILDWPHVESDLFFVVFAKKNSLYIRNEKDPETNYLKRMGYAFGDTLKNELHPLIF